MMPWEIYVCVLLLIVIDYITGIAGAIANKNFSSTVMREGLLHKLVYVFAFAVGIIVNHASNFIDLGFVYGSSILSLIIIWVSVTEISSILENLTEINPELKKSELFKIFAHVDNEEEEK